MSFKLEIPRPCPEDWDKMKIGLHSRFCENCQKDVVDFTGMSREEILRYVLANHNKQLCARLYPSQVDFTHMDPWIIIEGLSAKQRKSNLPFYILTIGALTLAGCNGSQPSDPTGNKQDSVYVNNKGDTTTTTNGNKHRHELELTGIVITEPQLRCTNDGGAISLPGTMPEYKGGVDCLVKYVQSQIRYPEWEQKHNIQGSVYVTFVISKTGKVENPRILKTVPGSKNFDTEVLRVVRSMPDWKPGEDNGKKVAVQYNLPVKFSLK